MRICVTSPASSLSLCLCPFLSISFSRSLSPLGRLCRNFPLTVARARWLRKRCRRYDLMLLCTPRWSQSREYILDSFEKRFWTWQNTLLILKETFQNVRVDFYCNVFFFLFFQTYTLYKKNYFNYQAINYEVTEMSTFDRGQLQYWSNKRFSRNQKIL